MRWNIKYTIFKDILITYNLGISNVVSPRQIPQTDNIFLNHFINTEKKTMSKKVLKIIKLCLVSILPGVILWMRQANERKCNIVTSSLIGWAHT